MNFEDQLSSEDLISANNELLKAYQKKEKDLRIFLDTSNTIIPKIEYSTMYWSCSFDTINHNKWYIYIYILSII